MELARQREAAAMKREQERVEREEKRERDQVAREERREAERKEREDKHWWAVNYAREMDTVNRFMEAEQIRHHQDLVAGRPYVPVVPYVDYSTIREQPQEVIDQVRWPQGVSSSYLPTPRPTPPPPPAEGPSSSADPFSDYHGWMDAIFGHSSTPYPPPGPNDPYYR